MNDPVGPVVYFISSIFGGPVKIGFTARPLEVRLAELTAGSPMPLACVAWSPGRPDLESRLHAQFHRSRLHGEWFSRSTELDCLIDECGFGGPIDSPAADPVVARKRPGGAHRAGPGTRVPTDGERTVVQEVRRAMGDVRAADALGLNRRTLARIAAGLPVFPGTLVCLRDRLATEGAPP